VAEATMNGQPGFFDLSDRYEALSAAGDPLERLAASPFFDRLRMSGARPWGEGR